MIFNKFDFDKKDNRVPILIEPKLFRDDRGYFFESFNLEEFKNAVGYDINFVQDNESMSK